MVDYYSHVLGTLINGKVISGAQPFEMFRLVIDSELEKAGITPPVVEEEPEA
jgi:hypothetical protein